MKENVNLHAVSLWSCSVGTWSGLFMATPLVLKSILVSTNGFFFEQVLLQSPILRSEDWNICMLVCLLWTTKYLHCDSFRMSLLCSARKCTFLFFLSAQGHKHIPQCSAAGPWTYIPYRVYGNVFAFSFQRDVANASAQRLWKIGHCQTIKWESTVRLCPPVAHIRTAVWDYCACHETVIETKQTKFYIPYEHA